MNICEFAIYRAARIRASQLIEGEKLTVSELYNAERLFELTAERAFLEPGEVLEMGRIVRAQKILQERMRGRVQ